MFFFALQKECSVSQPFHEKQSLSRNVSTQLAAAALGIYKKQDAITYQGQFRRQQRNKLRHNS